MTEDRSPPPAAPRTGRLQPEDLNGLSDAELLRVRICDLPLDLRQSELRPLVDQLHRELRARGLVFRPPCYLSTEWFVEKGGTAIGIPFWRAHPRLVRLERRLVLDVEGDAPEEAMKILRHEAGHAVAYAYDLDRDRELRRVFGPGSQRYPDHYTPKPYSRSFVRHLDNWYAQSHPDEDFAETFAVWLRPHSEWPQRYRNWPGALRKLQAMDHRMTRLAGRRPKNARRGRVEAFWTIRRTLQEYYDERLATLARGETPEFMDADLLRLFAPATPEGEPAYRFIRRHRRAIREVVARWAGMKKYNVDHMLADMLGRCRELRLRRVMSEPDAVLHLVACCVALSKNYLFAGRFSMSS